MYQLSVRGVPNISFKVVIREVEEEVQGALEQSGARALSTLGMREAPQDRSLRCLDV